MDQKTRSVDRWRNQLALHFVRFLLGSGLVVAALLCQVVPAAAAAEQKLTISPVSNAIAVNPGASYQGTMTVANQGSAVADMTFYASPYFVTGQQYSPIFNNVNQSVRADAWVHVVPHSATVAAQGVVSVAYTVSPPANARPGGYYAVLFAQAGTAGGAGTVGLSERAGEILYVTVNGPAVKAGSVQFASLPLVTFSTGVHPSVLIHNMGSVHFEASAEWSIVPIFGGPVNGVQKSVYVLPGTARQVDAPVTLSPHFGVGVYRITRTVTVLGTPTQNVAYIVTINPAWILIALAGVMASLLVRYKHVRHTRSNHV